MKALLKSLIIPIVISSIAVIAIFMSQKTSVPELVNRLIGKSEPQNTSTIHSNQWYSSIYNSFPSYPLYALPLAYRLTEDGLGFSYPEISASEKNVAAPYIEDFSVGIDSNFTANKVDEIYDWNIKARLYNATDEMTFALGHGIPHTTITSSTDGLIIKIPNGYSVFPENGSETKGDFRADSFVITTRNHNYVFYAQTDSPILIDDRNITIDSNKLFVGLLPNRSLYGKFLEIADDSVTSTNVDFSLTDKVHTTFSLKTAKNKKSLVALYIHQKDFVKNLSPLGMYKSLRGDLTLIEADSFVTSIPMEKLSFSFKKIDSNEELIKTQIKEDVAKLLDEKVPESKNYYLGTYFGKVATLIQLADSYGMTSEKQKVVDFVSPLFIDSLSHYEFDPNQTSLVALESEFGNKQLNDHHFHYGYYIRLASILIKDRPNLKDNIEKPITEMVNDIATTDKNSNKYPYLRNFDLYEGHSWADGYANFFDGNNQESSSEALNAWYSLFMWGEITNNHELSDYAKFLFSTELNSVKHYWFNTKGIYPNEYKHKIASIVWGGKVDFTTWFSSNTNMIYGIQLLPFTPASIYLQNIMPFSSYNEDFLTSGGTYSGDWGDLMTMWRGLSEAKTQEKELIRENLQENNPASLYKYYLIYGTHLHNNL